MRARALSLVPAVAVGILVLSPAASAGEPAGPVLSAPCAAPCAPPPPPKPCDPCVCADFAGAVPLLGGWVECQVDRIQDWKKRHRIPVEVGAWHWFHYGNDSQELDYGLAPDLEGTYYWYVNLDPSFEPCSSWVTKVGAHAQVRFRENEDKFRPWFDENVWLWEAYAYAETKAGTFKAGNVWKRFGFDWDGSWYGNLPYFDGWKLDPDWGFSWEHTSEATRRNSLVVDTYLQLFLAEDEVNGSISGADAESSDDSEEGVTGVARAVAKWRAPDCSLLSFGVSALFGEVEHPTVGDETLFAGALDLSWQKDRWKVYGEVMFSDGVVSEAHYVTGGPSDSSLVWTVGGQYVVGPLTLRATYQHATYENPGGDQSFLLLGTTVAVAKNVDLYLEYVKWDVNPDAGAEVEFEDGFNLIVNWRL